MHRTLIPKAPSKEEIFSVKKYTAIVEGVEWLLTTGFIREAHYLE